jgi:hypothetical protein
LSTAVTVIGGAVDQVRGAVSRVSVGAVVSMVAASAVEDRDSQTLEGSRRGSGTVLE